MNINLEFHLRVDDIHVVGEFKIGLDWLPPLGSLFYMHGVRFSVSDVVTTLAIEERPFRDGQKVKVWESDVKVECSCSFETDEAFTKALVTLAHGEVRFDDETLELVEAAGE